MRHYLAADRVGPRRPSRLPVTRWPSCSPGVLGGRAREVPARVPGGRRARGRTPRRRERAAGRARRRPRRPRRLAPSGPCRGLGGPDAGRHRVARAGRRLPDRAAVLRRRRRCGEQRPATRWPRCPRPRPCARRSRRSRPGTCGFLGDLDGAERHARARLGRHRAALPAPRHTRRPGSWAVAGWRCRSSPISRPRCSRSSPPSGASSLQPRPPRERRGRRSRRRTAARCAAHAARHVRRGARSDADRRRAPAAVDPLHRRPSSSPATGATRR